MLCISFELQKKLSNSVANRLYIIIIYTKHEMRLLILHFVVSIIVDIGRHQYAIRQFTFDFDLACSEALKGILVFGIANSYSVPSHMRFARILLLFFFAVVRLLFMVVVYLLVTLSYIRGSEEIKANLYLSRSHTSCFAPTKKKNKNLYS